MGLLCALTFLLAAAPIYAQVAPAPAQLEPAPGRIVAIGDVHGELDSLVGILQTAGLLDAKQKWAGGDTTLVVTGDMIDRGARSRAVMDLLMALEKQAPKKGGRAVIMLGDHEAMNVYGDLRYTTPEIFATFAKGNSEKRRQSAWRDYQKFLRARARAEGKPEPVFTPEMQQEWMTAHPLGYFEQRDAFGPKGVYGRWVRRLPPVVRIGDTLFVHAGISPALAGWKLDDINLRVHNEFDAFDGFFDYLLRRRLILPFFSQREILDAAQAEYDALTAPPPEAEKPRTLTPEEQRSVPILKDFLSFGSWLTVNRQGPLWFRGYANWPDAEGDAQVTSYLAAQNLQHIVCGHSTIKGGHIKVRFGGKVFLIDTGMLSSQYPGGRASALEIQNGQFTAIYPDRRVLLPLQPVPSPPEPSNSDEMNSGAVELGGGAVEQAAAAPARVWKGPDGKPLPFKTDEEVMEFMRTATVVSMSPIGQGVTRPQKVLLEKDGIHMNAAFRTVDQNIDVYRPKVGKEELNFRDSYEFECAAYELSRLLGIDRVPPAILRTVRGQKGSLQVWIENAINETTRVKRKIRPPDPVRWSRQMRLVTAWDALIYNVDRNAGNSLFDPDWNLWMIDHTRTFRDSERLQDPDSVNSCERTFFEKLRTVDDDAIRQAVKPYLKSREIDGLLKRRQKLVEHIEKLIREFGEAGVLYTLGEQ